MYGGTRAKKAHTAGVQPSHPQHGAAKDGDGGSSHGRASLPTSFSSLGKGGGAIKSIGANINVNGANGTLSFSVPIPLSKSRSDFGPALNLTYDSGHGNGAFGLGWGLSLSSVVRQTSRNIPLYDDEKDTFVLSGEDDLVPLLDSGNWKEKTIGEFVVRQYQPRVVSQPMRIERWSKLASPWDIHWRTITSDNVTSVFGRDQDSRISNEATDRPCIFAWLITDMYDTWGNAVQFSYKQEDESGLFEDGMPLWEMNRSSDVRRRQKYIKSIRYGNTTPCRQLQDWDTFVRPSEWMFVVVFDYGEHAQDVPLTTAVQNWKTRKDPFTSCSSGFEIRNYRLCRRILMFHHFPDEIGVEDALTSSLMLEYDETPHGSFLSSCTALGHSVQNEESGLRYITKSMPPLAFKYSQLPSPEALQLKKAKTSNIPYLPVGTTDKSEWIDLNGEGSPGILTTLDGGTLHFQRNQSALRKEMGPCFTDFRILGSQPTLPEKYHLQDLAGTGCQDLVCFDELGRPYGYFERTEADGWSDFSTLSSISSSSASSDRMIYIDLTGDGLADALDPTSLEYLVWQQSLGKLGFGIHQTSQAPATGPLRLQSDDRLSVKSADMTGDGLSDIVAISNGRVSYWSNTGYGNFSNEVMMSNAPVFDSDDSFSHGRLHLMDTDGSGTADLLYVLPKGGAHLYYNLCGNSWSDAVYIPAFPPVDKLASVQVVDLLGSGTSCLCWTGPSPDASDSMCLQYLDLMDSAKPHLLRSYANGMGLEVDIQYEPSTHFYLVDESELYPWETKLPFPVHCVSQITTTDQVSSISKTVKYRYHDGFFDPQDREFRGFGMVEQQEEELFPTKDLFFTASSSLTKTWYSTGSDRPTSRPYFSPSAIFQHLPQLEYQVDIHEAKRSLRGKVLRSEIHDCISDGVPYAVTENVYNIISVQLKTDQTACGIVWALPSEVLTTALGMQTNDPHIVHKMVLSTNEFGDPQTSATITYQSRSYGSHTTGTARGAMDLSTVIEVEDAAYTNSISDNFNFRKSLPCQTELYRIHGTELSTIVDINQVGQLLRSRRAKDVRDEKSHETRVYYQSSDLTKILPLGRLETFSTLHQTFVLGFTAEMLQDMMLRTGNFGDQADLSQMASQGGYVDLDSNGCLWAPSGTQGFPSSKDSTELAAARSAFFVPSLSADPFGNQSTVEYDKYFLLKTSMTNALGSKVSWENNYEKLQPTTILDENSNVHQCLLDPLGHNVGTAIVGKPDQSTGSTVQDLDPTPHQDLIDSLFDQPTEALSKQLLGSADERVIYDLERRHRYGTAPNKLCTAAVASIVRVGSGIAAESVISLSITYLDGQSNPYQTFDYHGEEGSEWRCQSCVLKNSHQEVVQTYQAFYTDSHLPRPPSKLDGLIQTSIYDAMQREVVTVFANATWSKTVYSPWSISHYDVSDTIHISDPSQDQDIGRFVASFLSNLQWTSWLEAQKKGDDSQRLAAEKSEQYPVAPVVTHLTPGDEVWRETKGPDSNLRNLEYVYDDDHNTIMEYDELGRAVMSRRFNLLNQCIYQGTMDGGDHISFSDCEGKPLLSWDRRGTTESFVYDELRRETETWVTTKLHAKQLTVSMIYGEKHPTAQDCNIRGQIWKQMDQSGVTSFSAYDNRGCCTSQTLQLCREYKTGVSWGDQVEMEATVYEHQDLYNHLGQVVESRDANNNQTKKSYDRLGRLTQISLSSTTATSESDWKPIVSQTTYTADDLVLTTTYGNESQSSCTYNTLTRQLENEKVRDKKSKVLEDITTTYDCLGRKIRKVNDAQQDIFFRNQQIKPASSYTYDIFGQLIAATGREQIDSSNGNGSMAKPYSSTESLASQGQRSEQRLCEFLELYEYDTAGNMTSMSHQPASDSKVGGWTRRYFYEEPSFLDPNVSCNRLSRTVVSGTEERYGYDNDAGQLGLITSMPGFSSMQWGYRRMLSSSSKQTVTNGVPETTFFVYNHQGHRLRKVTERASSDGSPGSKMADTIQFREAKIEMVFTGSGELRRTSKASSIVGASRIASVESQDNFTRDVLFRYEVSPSLELDAQGRLINYEEYSPYGACTFRASSGQIGASREYRFRRYLRDSETGLDLCGARYYASWIGRWLSPDPAGTVDGPNIYAYCTNDPINFVDSEGTVKSMELKGPRMMLNGVSQGMSKPAWRARFAKGYRDRARQRSNENKATYDPRLVNKLREISEKARLQRRKELAERKEQIAGYSRGARYDRAHFLAKEHYGKFERFEINADDYVVRLHSDVNQLYMKATFDASWNTFWSKNYDRLDKMVKDNVNGNDLARAQEEIFNHARTLMYDTGLITPAEFDEHRISYEDKQYMPRKMKSTNPEKAYFVTPEVKDFNLEAYKKFNGDFRLPIARRRRAAGRRTPRISYGNISPTSKNDPDCFYGDRTLPSRQGNFVHVNFSSLVKSLVQGPSLKLFMEKRSAVEEACRKYEKRLFAEDQYGVARFRGVNQHDTYCCSIEQTVSFTAVPNKASWAAIYLTDEGTSFLQDVRLPWTSYHNYSTSLQGGTVVGTVPIVPYNKPITAESCDWNIGISESSMNNRNGSSNRHERGSDAFPLSPAFSQLHPSRSIVVHDEADMELLSEDPFFLLASLFTTSALSFMQLLNYLSLSINEDHSLEVDLLDIKLERLRNHVRIIHRVEAALAENLQWIAQGGCSTWPRARTGMSAAIRKEAVQNKLRTDHEALRQKCAVMRQDSSLWGAQHRTSPKGG
ncbi:insecticidal toxin complex [Fusarium tjaetaba]|uniref:Insecticidal toxin complex n=1 Tax=Fusarium tjaetaba TaxID=1567544 RepID=A0A8H5RB87_9HYPO|nr:insecticidal toxin complex [Fusarium tjaetaba]KAF5629910.1 insecticidal toxin complex [Fusarium tjaetaba]